jgi:hypothetical protein
MILMRHEKLKMALDKAFLESGISDTAYRVITRKNRNGSRSKGISATVIWDGFKDMDISERLDWVYVRIRSVVSDEIRLAIKKIIVVTVEEFERDYD